MTHPYPPPHDARTGRRARRATAWLWIPIAVGALTVIAAGALVVNGSFPWLSGGGAGEPASAEDARFAAPPTEPPGDDPNGWNACRRLRELGATTFDRDVNRELGQLARQSTHDEIVARGADLIEVAKKTAGEDPIDANLALSRAQLALADACRRVFGDTSR